MKAEICSLKVEFMASGICKLIALIVLIYGSVTKADWANNYNGLTGSSTAIRKIITDGSNNTYVIGSFNSSTLVMGGTTMTRIGNSADIFVTKFDSSGTVLWAKNFGGATASVTVNGIAVDGSGNIFLAGYFQSGSMTTPALTLIGSWDTFAIKLDSSGNTTWAKNFGGAGAVAYCNDIAIDGSGNSYLTGHFQTANLTNPILTKIGSADVFVFKLDSSGNVTWAKNFGGASSNTESRSVAVDGSGNVYLTGDFSTANFTTPALTRIGTVDAFVFKLDSSGNVTWAKNYGGTIANSYSVVVDGSGNIFVGGQFQSANMTTPALTKIGNVDVFVLKLDSSGNTTWSRNYGGAGVGLNFFQLSMDGTGNVYVVGAFLASNFTTPALTLIGVRDTYVIKIDTSGNTTWSKNFGGVGANAYGLSLAVDGNSDVYVAGRLTTASITTPAISLLGTQDAFIIKLDSSGNTTRASGYPGYSASGTTNLSGVARDTSGNLYIVGNFTSSIFNIGGFSLNKIGTQDIFAAKLDAAGNVIWAKNYGGSGSSGTGSGVAVDGTGNVYIVGYLLTANFTTPALSRIGVADAIVLKLDTSGNTTWAKNYGGAAASAYGRSLAVDGSGNVYLAGDFSTADLTTPALTRIGIDSFAIKLDPSGNTIWAKNFGGAGVSAGGKSIKVDGSGNVYLAGDFSSASLTNPALTKIGTRDAYVIKLDSSGNTTWSKNYGGAGATSYGATLALDGSSNVYLGGYFTGASLTTPVLPQVGVYDAYILKLDSSGSTIWSHNYGGASAYTYGNAIVIDSTNSVYFIGNFMLGSLTTPVLTKIGSRDIFVIKLDSSGSTTLSINYGGAGAQAYPSDIITDGNGNIYVAGSFTTNNLTTPPVTRLANQDALILNTQLFKTSCTTAGKFKFDTANNVMVFCDGSLWQSMNNAPASTCTGTTTGKVQYYSNGGSSDFVWYAGTCRSAKSSTTFGACATNGKIEWDAGNSTLRGCINGTWTSFKGW
jgi:hypothetical protein